MRVLISISALALLATASPFPSSVVDTALAKKPKHALCSGRFVLDARQAPLLDVASPGGIEAVVLDGKRVTIGGTCSGKGVIHATRHGWRIQAHWSSCSAGPKARFTATVGYDCTNVTGSLKAKRKPTKRFLAHRTGCGDRIVDSAINEQCDPPGPNCTDKCVLPACVGSGQAYASTWDAIQKAIFAPHDCANDLCHGSAKQADLDLRPEAAYASLVQAPSNQVPFMNRVQPGDPRRSYLWLKLLAKTDPARVATEAPGVPLAGSPMPSNNTTLTNDEIEALRLWIYATAPETGTVEGTQSLLGGCLPPPGPITAIPLDPPPAGEGVQFVMPPWKLEAHSEHEICFATYYDFTDQVPADFQDNSFGAPSLVWNAQTLRQDPQSHHLILNRFIGDASQIHDPSFGTWTCNGGERAGQVCEPTDLASCGSGLCASSIKQSFACIGFGPGNGGLNNFSIGGAQKAQAQIDFVPGVWAPLPLKGIVFWNSHAFNLTDQDTEMHAWLNYYFAKDKQYLVNQIFTVNHIFDAGAAKIQPYTQQTVCADYVFNVPAGKQANLFDLSSHTHRHGKHFWVEDPQQGNAVIYDSFIYNDPIEQRYDPPRVYGNGQKLHFCSKYNNGMAADGSPDTTLVTRASHVPPDAPAFSRCKPVACVAGKMSPPAACTTNADCDSSPGAGDGLCDACPIAAGESTENEMFLLIGQYFAK